MLACRGMERISDRLISWTPEHDGAVYAQAARTASLPIVHGHVALMPDAHVGIGATVGSVIATEGAIIPSAVGVDIGCGMVAMNVAMSSDALGDNASQWMQAIQETVPAGVGRGHQGYSSAALRFAAQHPLPSSVDSRLAHKALGQFGSLGSGNHFLEVCLDEDDGVWVVLHSGSRGVGKELAEIHISRAKALNNHPLEDLDLAWFTQGTEDFDAYLRDMLWAQEYALANREAMAWALWKTLVDRHLLPPGPLLTINCHHNFCQQEVHDGKTLWVTRKGAIEAKEGQPGIIPGSMGTKTYLVVGKGNSMSWRSCSHGAGRRLSRGQARRTLDVDSLKERMEGRVWQDDQAHSLLDEHPDAYKDIDAVMAAQSDLVDVLHTLTQVINYKGT